jgi:NCAIR mutase (PurE)-related protein
MDEQSLTALLHKVASGELPPAAAVSELRDLPFKDLGYARIDHHRALRQGVPEVVFAAGKTAEQVLGIARELLRKDQAVLVTRVSVEQAEYVTAHEPSLRHDPTARTLTRLGKPQVHRAGARVLIVTAGTADLPVAAEAASTLHACGIDAERLNDVGVAGLHRVLAELPRLTSADVLIVVAGMEGALASVVGGLVAAPVIAVPTSVGYGAAFGGVAALLGMLTSCASGISVVNIDNGFGAALAAVRIVDRLRPALEQPHA